MNKPKKFKVVINGTIHYINSKPELNKFLGAVTKGIGVVWGDPLTIKISLVED